MAGGACRTERPFRAAPELAVSTGAYVLGLVPPELVRDLELDLPLIRRDPHSFLPGRTGPPLLVGSDPARGPGAARGGVLGRRRRRLGAAGPGPRGTAGRPGPVVAGAAPVGRGDRGAPRASLPAAPSAGPGPGDGGRAPGRVRLRERAAPLHDRGHGRVPRGDGRVPHAGRRAQPPRPPDGPAPRGGRGLRAGPGGAGRGRGPAGAPGDRSRRGAGRRHRRPGGGDGAAGEWWGS